MHYLVKDGVIDFCAALLRVQWDTAVTAMDDGPPFAGKTILTFRPWWTAPEEQHTQFTIIIGSFGIADTRVSQLSNHNGVNDE